MANMMFGRLLIVDDEIELLNSLADKLAKQGYETVRFSSPYKALQALASENFDLLLTDLMMPEMDGITLLQAAREIDPYLVGIVMTGQATVQTAVEALKMGALDYVLKPFKIQAILPALARALEIRRLRQENLHLRETVGIYELCNAISFTLDLPTLLNKIADAAIQQCEADEASIMLPTEEGDEFRIAVVRGADRSHLLGKCVAMDQGIAGWVSRHREPVTLSREVVDERFAPIYPRPDLRTAMSLPLLVGGQLIGVLNVGSTTRRHTFTMGQVKSLSILGNTGAAAIQSATLHGQLRQAEDQFRSIFENAREGIVQTTPEGKPLFVNPALARMLGYQSPDDFIASVPKIGTLDYLPPEIRANVVRQLESTGSAQDVETRIARQDGSTIWVSLRARVVRDAQGHAVAHESTIEDITKDKRAERRAATEHAIAHILAEAGDATEVLSRILQAVCQVMGWDHGAAWLLDKRDNLLRCETMWHSNSTGTQDSETHTQTLELSQAKCLLGRVCTSLEPIWISNISESNECVHKEAANNAGFKSGFAFPILTDTDLLGVVELYRTEIMEDDREFVATARTIGSLIGEFLKRKQAEDELKLSEQRYRDLVEAAPDIIFGVDTEGRFTHVNSAMTTILGWSISEWLQKPFPGLVHADDLPMAMDAFSQLMQGHRLPVLELRLSTFAGACVDMEFTTAPQIQGGAIVGALAIARNITQRKRLEAQLHQAQKMEAFGQLAGGVAHDFNNLLTIIGGYSEILLSLFPHGDSAREMAEQIHRAGERATSLTRQLLAFSRQQVLEPKVLVLNSIVSDTEKMLRRLIGEDVELVTSFDPNLNRVKVDPGQIEQVIMNLAVNARDAMPQGGKLMIETQNVTLGDESAKVFPDAEPGRYVLLAIGDSGNGMTQDVKARIFEPFYTTKGVGKGTGLGLAVVQGIIKQSGGTIEVHSEVGRGTTFKIYLPEVREHLTSLSGHGQARPVHGTEIILLVEDEPTVRELAALSLEGYGYNVLKAACGTSALRLMEDRSGKIDLLVTDVVMPEMSGGKLAESLMKNHPDIKVLFLSGYTDDAVFRHGVQRSEVAFLQKPFTPTALARKVREVLDKEGR